MLCNQIRVQSSAQISNMHTACRARCKSCSDFSHNSTSFCLFFTIQHLLFSSASVHYLHKALLSDEKICCDFLSDKKLLIRSFLFRKRSYYNPIRTFPQGQKEGCCIKLQHSFDTAASKMYSNLFSVLSKADCNMRWCPHPVLCIPRIFQVSLHSEKLADPLLSPHPADHILPYSVSDNKFLRNSS